MLLAGIDLGGRTTSKTAVTTYNTQTKKLVIHTTDKIAEITRKDDRRFISFLNSLNADIIGIDAPLSLPDTNTVDYLYRKADREVKALSPFTIGEITARAMYLKTGLTTRVFEVYPKSLLQLHKLPSIKYKDNPVKIEEITNFISEEYELVLPSQNLSGDDLDSILCTVILLHFTMGAYQKLENKTPFIIPLKMAEMKKNSITL